MTSMTTQTTGAWVPSDTFANRLVLIRRELGGISVKEAALRCGLNYATWSTWENGRKPADMGTVVSKIVEGLGVDRDWLMWGLQPSQPTPPGKGLPSGPLTHGYAGGLRVLAYPAAA